MNLIQSKLDDISEFLIEENPENIEGDFFTGSAGVALFLFYYSRYTKKAVYEEKATTFLLKSIDFIDQSAATGLNHTFCRGISGICWCIDHLISNGFISSENSEILSHFDNFLSDTSVLALRAGNNDFLHGAIGTSIYLLKRVHIPKVKQSVESVIDTLYDQKKVYLDDQHYYWTHKAGTLANGETCNLGISHGMSSICIFLSKAIKSNIGTLKAGELLEKTTRFFLSQEIKEANWPSRFPSYSFVSDPNFAWTRKSRMGWCFGDLGIALSLWHYSQLIKSEELERKAIEIFLSASERKEPLPNWVIDCGICHGTSGIALIFQRMYQYTKLEPFKISANYWMELTIAMAKKGNGYCGYLADNMNPSMGFLDGISGIGLVLLGFQTQDSTNWDECLLLS